MDGKNFIVWTMQRTGGTTFTSLLGSMHASPAVHEPFNGRNAKLEYRADIHSISKGSTPNKILGRNIKHCYEYSSDDFNSNLLNIAEECGFVSILLERRDELSRIESLALAKLTGAYGVKKADEMYPKIRKGEISIGAIDIASEVAHVRRCQRRTSCLKKLLQSRSALHYYYEDVYAGSELEVSERFEKIFSKLRRKGLQLMKSETFEKMKGEYITRRKQHSHSIADFVPNIHEFREVITQELKELNQ
jgi:hypothetical protein